jgi:hypothetical protein
VIVVVDVVVDVFVLVDVLVLVLVLANIDVDRKQVQPPPAGSAMEGAAVLGVVRLLGVGTDEQHRQAVERLGRMGWMGSR